MTRDLRMAQYGDRVFQRKDGRLARVISDRKEIIALAEGGYHEPEAVGAMLPGVPVLLPLPVKTAKFAQIAILSHKDEANMSVLTDYTDEEKILLMEGPRLGAVVVSAASPGRATETASEGFAAVQYAISSRGEFLDNTLIGAIQFELGQLANSDRRFANYSKLASEPDAKDAALARLGQLADLLDRKSTPAEAAGYKKWVMNAATLASEAGQEGGNFLGWGAVLVNDAEKAALVEIAATLRIQS